MHLKPETQKIQNQLADYCRSGELTPIEGAKTDRLPTYRRLIYNVIDGSLEQAFPISRAILEDDQWEEMLQAYFTLHNSSSNQIWQMPYEFYSFVASQNFQEEFNIPYLLDLLLFEWTEIEIFCKEDDELPQQLSQHLSFDEVLYFNPDSTILHLNYPVHKYPAKELSSKKGDYFLFIFRDVITGKVHFTEISPLHVAIINNCAENKEPFTDVLSKVFKQFGLSTNDSHFNSIKDFITSISEIGGVLGSGQ